MHNESLPSIYMGLNPKFLSGIYLPNSLSFTSSYFGYTRVSEEIIYLFIHSFIHVPSFLTLYKKSCLQY